MEDVVEDRERLEDVTPVLALVVQSLVEHFDDLDKVVSARFSPSTWLYIGAE
jgi:hypothetical protein